jgi:hypothetical protein
MLTRTRLEESFCQLVKEKCIRFYGNERTKSLKTKQKTHYTVEPEPEPIDAIKQDPLGYEDESELSPVPDNSESDYEEQSTRLFRPTPRKTMAPPDVPSHSFRPLRPVYPYGIGRAQDEDMVNTRSSSTSPNLRRRETPTSHYSLRETTGPEAPSNGVGSPHSPMSTRGAAKRGRADTGQSEDNAQKRTRNGSEVHALLKPSARPRSLIVTLKLTPEKLASALGRESSRQSSQPISPAQNDASRRESTSNTSAGAIDPLCGNHAQRETASGTASNANQTTDQIPETYAEQQVCHNNNGPESTAPLPTHNGHDAHTGRTRILVRDLTDVVAVKVEDYYNVDSKADVGQEQEQDKEMQDIEKVIEEVTAAGEAALRDYNPVQAPPAQAARAEPRLPLDAHLQFRASPQPFRPQRLAEKTPSWTAQNFAPFIAANIPNATLFPAPTPAVPATPAANGPEALQAQILQQTTLEIIWAQGAGNSRYLTVAKFPTLAGLVDKLEAYPKPAHLRGRRMTQLSFNLVEPPQLAQRINFDIELDAGRDSDDAGYRRLIRKLKQESVVRDIEILVAVEFE